MRLFLSGLFCAFMVFQSATCSAGNYQVTEEELTRLEENLDDLSTITEEQKKELSGLRTSLYESRTESAKLYGELTDLKKVTDEQKISLEKAEKSFEEYVQEERKRQNKYRHQRNGAYCLMALLAVIAMI